MTKRTIGRIEKAFFTFTILAIVFVVISALNQSIALLILSVPIYIVWGIMAFAYTEKKIKKREMAVWRNAQEKALKVIKENLTQEFSVVHPTANSLREYEYCGVTFKAKWDEENQAVIVIMGDDSEGKIYSETKIDNYVVFVLEYIDRDFKYL